MLLGSIMNELRDKTVAAAALMQLGDVVLTAEVEAARIPHDESIGEYVSGAAQRFAHGASDDDWLALMMALERTGNPAVTCLTTMLRWSIANDAKTLEPDATSSGCSCGGGGGNCHDSP
jgi:hypothetical protein